MIVLIELLSHILSIFYLQLVLLFFICFHNKVIRYLWNIILEQCLVYVARARLDYFTLYEMFKVESRRVF